MRIDGPSPLTVALLQVWSSSGDPQANPASTAQVTESTTGDADTRGRVFGVRDPVLTTPVAGRLRIEFDKASGIYVQTLTDPQTHEVLRQFPHALQLEFARAARAYVQARLDRG